jgi:hypothetical protein
LIQVPVRLCARLLVDDDDEFGHVEEQTIGVEPCRGT